VTRMSCAELKIKTTCFDILLLDVGLSLTCSLVSSNFWMALSFRFFLGCFNSLLGSVRACASKICSEEHRALALSV
ncbi:hypothetical protein Droror1_Dr00026582, partial [Drosera rotundifolia]